MSENSSNTAQKLTKWPKDERITKGSEVKTEQTFEGSSDTLHSSEVVALDIHKQIAKMSLTSPDSFTELEAEGSSDTPISSTEGDEHNMTEGSSNITDSSAEEVAEHLGEGNSDTPDCSTEAEGEHVAKDSSNTPDNSTEVKAERQAEDNSGTDNPKDWGEASGYRDPLKPPATAEQLEHEVKAQTAILKALAAKDKWSCILSIEESCVLHPGTLDVVIGPALAKNNVDFIINVVGGFRFHETTLLTVLRTACLNEAFMPQAKPIIHQLPSTLNKQGIKSIYRSLERWHAGDFSVGMEVLGMKHDILWILRNHFGIEEDPTGKPFTDLWK